MHIFHFEQEGGVRLTLGCREVAGHQRARSPCGQEDREGVQTPDHHSFPLFIQSVPLVFNVILLNGQHDDDSIFQ